MLLTLFWGNPASVPHERMTNFLASESWLVLTSAKHAAVTHKIADSACAARGAYVIEFAEATLA
jgi:hypothetical protein